MPGYAKTDPANGVDRYAENNRITRVRWRFDDGTTFVQRMSANPGDRSMRTMRIPVTQTSRVVLEILGSQARTTGHRGDQRDQGRRARRAVSRQGPAAGRTSPYA